MPRSKATDKYLPTTGVRTDLKRVMNSFLAYNSVRYEQFSEVWRSKNMSYLCAGRCSDREAREFIERVMSIAQEYFLPPFQFQVRVGGLYLLYAIFQIQPIIPKVKIRITPAQWQDTLYFQQQAAQQNHLDVVYVFQRLLQEQAFNFCFTATEMSHQTHMKEAEDKEENLADCLKEERTIINHLFNYESLEQLSYLQDQYQQMKIGLAGPKAAKPDKSLDVVHGELVEDLVVMLQSFKAKIASISHGKQINTEENPDEEEEAEVETTGSRRKSLKAQAYSSTVAPSRKTHNVIAMEPSSSFSQGSPRSQSLKRGLRKGPQLDDSDSLDDSDEEYIPSGKSKRTNKHDQKVHTRKGNKANRSDARTSPESSTAVSDSKMHGKRSHIKKTLLAGCSSKSSTAASGYKKKSKGHDKTVTVIENRKAGHSRQDHEASEGEVLSDDHVHDHQYAHLPKKAKTKRASVKASSDKIASTSKKVSVKASSSKDKNAEEELPGKTSPQRNTLSTRDDRQCKPIGQRGNSKLVDDSVPIRSRGRRKQNTTASGANKLTVEEIVVGKQVGKPIMVQSSKVYKYGENPTAEILISDEDSALESEVEETTKRKKTQGGNTRKTSTSAATKTANNTGNRRGRKRKHSTSKDGNTGALKYPGTTKSRKSSKQVDEPAIPAHMQQMLKQVAGSSSVTVGSKPVKVIKIVSKVGESPQDAIRRLKERCMKNVKMEEDESVSKFTKKSAQQEGSRQSTSHGMFDDEDANQQATNSKQKFKGDIPIQVMFPRSTYPSYQGPGKKFMKEEFKFI